MVIGDNLTFVLREGNYEKKTAGTSCDMKLKNFILTKQKARPKMENKMDGKQLLRDKSDKKIEKKSKKNERKIDAGERKNQNLESHFC